MIYFKIHAHFSFFKVNKCFRIFHKRRSELILGLLLIRNLAIVHWKIIARRNEDIIVILDMHIIVIIMIISFKLITSFLKFSLLIIYEGLLFSMIIWIIIVILHINLLILT